MQEAIQHLHKINRGISKMSLVKNKINAEVEEINKNLKAFSRSLLTRSEICRALEITEPTLIKYRKMGAVPFIKLGKCYFYIYLRGGNYNG